MNSNLIAPPPEAISGYRHWMDQNALERTLAGICPSVRFLEETDSTNRVALEWAQIQAAEEWSIVVADYQTAGRGRFDRTWFAPPGQCLLFSLILRPQCRPEETALINLAAAVALARSARDENLKAAVKWPNDVLIGGRKTAGILSEAFSPPAPAQTGGRRGVVLGVGINVNVSAFPPELAGSATSLALQAGRSIDRAGFLRRCLEHLRGLLELFPAGVVEAYLPWSDVLGRKVRIELARRTVEGRAEKIDALGNLVLDSGEVLSAGDVGYVRGRDA